MGQRIDPRMPKPEACVQRYMLERLAKRQPEKVFANYTDGTEWTYAQTLDLAIRTANAFRKLGVRQGDRVLVWLPNSADNLRVWFGLNYLGAVYVPINLAYGAPAATYGQHVRSADRHRSRRSARAARRGRDASI